MAQRDNKGRFVKGNTEGKNSPIRNGLATEMQQKSVQSRLANKRGAELVRAMLGDAVKDPVVLEALRKAGFTGNVTNEVALHARQIEKAQKTGDTKAYAALMKAAGYDTINIKSEVPLSIIFKDEKAVAGLEKALDTGAAPRKPKDEE